jgi:hypothetical protein
MQVVFSRRDALRAKKAAASAAKAERGSKAMLPRSVLVGQARIELAITRL